MMNERVRSARAMVMPTTRPLQIHHRAADLVRLRPHVGLNHAGEGIAHPADRAAHVFHLAQPVPREVRQERPVS